MTEIEMQAVVARIDRDLSESRRAREEAFKLMDERMMMEAKAKKLDAEAAKLRRDHWLAPWLAIAAVFGGIITLGQLLLRGLGVLP